MTLKSGMHFILFGTVFVPRTDVDNILDPTGGTVVVWHDVAFFLTSSIELAFRKLEQQHKEFEFLKSIINIINLKKKEI